MRGYLLFVAAVSGAMTLTVYAQAPTKATPESLVKDAKRAAGLDYAGTFLRICVAPDNLQAAPARGAAPPTARTIPDRALWYAKPIFDNLYFVGAQSLPRCDERDPSRLGSEHAPDFVRSGRRATTRHSTVGASGAPTGAAPRAEDRDARTAVSGSRRLALLRMWASQRARSSDQEPVGRR